MMGSGLGILNQNDSSEPKISIPTASQKNSSNLNHYEREEAEGEVFFFGSPQKQKRESKLTEQYSVSSSNNQCTFS